MPPIIQKLTFLDDGGHTLLMLQFTRNKTTHDAKADGLHRIDKYVLPQNTQKYYVVVTPEGIWPKVTVPLGYFGAEGVESPDTEFPVLHYPVSRRELFPH